MGMDILMMHTTSVSNFAPQQRWDLQGSLVISNNSHFIALIWGLLKPTASTSGINERGGSQTWSTILKFRLNGTFTNLYEISRPTIWIYKRSLCCLGTQSSQNSPDFQIWLAKILGWICRVRESLRIIFPLKVFWGTCSTWWSLLLKIELLLF